MATLYSTLYDAETNAYLGPQIERAGQTIAVYGTIETAVGASDIVNLFPVPAGAKVITASIKARTDLNAGNDFTFNFGYTSDTDAFLAASTGLQAAVVVTEAPTDTFAVAPAAAGDSVVLERAAGALVAGVIDFFVEVTLPVA
jgi:hypothetical protein